MAPQTSYSIDIPAVSYPGQIADDSNVRDIISALAVAAALPYGLHVVRDSSNSGGFDSLAAKLPASSADITTVGRSLGCVLADQARAQDPSVASAQYPQHSAVPCNRVGRVWVQSESAVADGAPVYVRWQTGDGGTQPGAYSGVLDTSVVGNALLAGAVWRGAVAAPGFACIEFNLV